MKKVFAGEIAAAVGLKDALTSNTLCDENNPILLEVIKFIEPVVSLRIEPKTKADQEKMGMALRKLANEDPTFKISSNSETGETIISGMGELHLEIMVDRMKREFTVEATVGKPQVAYRETILGTAEAEHKYIKQSGGKGQYGHVKINLKPMEPLVEGEKIPKNVKRYDDFEFIDSIKGGVIPNEFIPAVEKGVREAMDSRCRRRIHDGQCLLRTDITVRITTSTRPKSPTRLPLRSFPGRCEAAKAGHSRTDHESRSRCAGEIHR